MTVRLKVSDISVRLVLNFITTRLVVLKLLRRNTRRTHDEANRLIFATFRCEQTEKTVDKHEYHKWASDRTLYTVLPFRSA